MTRNALHRRIALAIILPLGLGACSNPTAWMKALWPGTGGTGGWSWAIVGGAGFTGPNVVAPSLAVAPDGTPFVGFVDGDVGNDPSVMYQIGSGWSYLGSRGFAAASAWDPSIAIDSGSRYYLSFHDASLSGKVSVYRFGSSWAPLGSPGFSAGQGLGTSLALDASDTPYVAFVDGTNPGPATVEAFDGTSWALVGSAGFSPGNADSLSLAIAPGGRPYIGFRDAFGGNYYATVMKFDGVSTWNFVGSEGFSVGWANYTSLAIDSAGTPYIGFQDSAYMAKVMQFDGTSWIDLGGAGAVSGNSVGRVSLAISRAAATKDSLYLAFSRQISSAPTYGVSVMKFNGSSWDILGSMDFYTDTYAPDSLQLAIAPNDGTPYVSIQSGGVVRVMAFRKGS